MDKHVIVENTKVVRISDDCGMQIWLLTSSTRKLIPITASEGGRLASSECLSGAVFTAAEDPLAPVLPQSRKAPGDQPPRLD